MGMGTALTLNIGWVQMDFEVFPEIRSPPPPPPPSLLIYFCSRFSSRKQQLALVRVRAVMIKKNIEVDEIGII